MILHSCMEMTLIKMFTLFWSLHFSFSLANKKLLFSDLQNDNIDEIC